MTQTNKFLYESQTTDFASSAELDEFRRDVDAAIQDRWETSFEQSGYISDCITKAKKNYIVKVATNSTTVIQGQEYVTYRTNVLTVGDTGVTSTFFIPDGPGRFIQKDINTKLTYNTLAADISAGKVTTGAHAIMIDFSDEVHPAIILAPLRKTNGTDYWQYMFARATEPTPVESEPIWWDTANNVMKRYTASNVWAQRNYSIPIGLVNVENSMISKMIKDFNISGYTDQTIWVNPNVKFDIPNGRKADLTLDVTEVTIEGSPEYINVPTTEVQLTDEFEVLPVDAIPSVRLTAPCRDSRTLEISIIDLNDEETEIPVEQITLSQDMVTVQFNPYITNAKKITCKYYEQPADMPIFISAAGELLNPANTKDFEYINDLGYYINQYNEKQDCVKLGIFSLGFVASKSRFEDEKLSITEYTSKDLSALLNTTEIENLIKQYNANLQESINLALRTATAAADDINSLRVDIVNSLTRCINIVNGGVQ